MLISFSLNYQLYNKNNEENNKKCTFVLRYIVVVICWILFILNIILDLDSSIHPSGLKWSIRFVMFWHDKVCKLLELLMRLAL